MIHWLLERTRVLGIAYLALLVGAVWLTHAIYAKKFTDYEEITLQTSHIGLQLPERADVKIDGMIVGEVLEMEAISDDGEAELTLGIYEDKVDFIPANVTGRIVPKTLFGQKYVTLVRPDRPDPDTPAIQAGAHISETEVPVEVERVLSDLYPLLRTVPPTELNHTLNAMSTALEGRGEMMGQAMVTADDYLRKFNPELPALIEDLRLAGETSDLWAGLLPELSKILENTMVTTGTLEEKEEDLGTMFDEVTRFSNVTGRFLRTNEENLVRVNEVQEPILRLFAKYSPEFPCLTAGIVKAARGQAESFRGFALHIVLEVLPHQPRAYNAGDAPTFTETRGPNCLNLPDSPYDQSNPFPFPHDVDTGVDGGMGKEEGGPLPPHRVAPDYDEPTTSTRGGGR